MDAILISLGLAGFIASLLAMVRLAKRAPNKSAREEDDELMSVW